MTALLFSGGMDSTALAWWRKPELAITVDYGQVSADAEVAAAAVVCKELAIAHEVVRVDFSSLGSGDLAGKPAHPLAPVPEWWPFRNQILVTVAAALCVRRQEQEILIGTVKSDSAHQDGTAEFISAMSALLGLQEGRLSLSAPGIGMTTAELIKQAAVPLEVLAWAHSCHTGNMACGRCRGCLKHREVAIEVYGVDF